MISDPRENITHEIKVGQVYEDERTGEVRQLCYFHADVVLLRSKGDASNDQWNRHLLEKRKPFEKNVGAGRYKLQGKEELEAEMETPDRHETMDFTDIDQVGQKAAEALQSNGYTTKGDIREASDEQLLEVPYIGETNLANIRERAT